MLPQKGPQKRTPSRARAARALRALDGARARGRSFLRPLLGKHLISFMLLPGEKITSFRNHRNLGKVDGAAWARERTFCQRKLAVKTVFFLVKQENFQ